MHIKTSVHSYQDTTKVVFFTVTFIIATLLFGMLAVLVKKGTTIDVDVAILQYIHQFASPAFDTFFKTLTNFGSAVLVAIVSLVIVTYLFIKRQYIKSAFVVASFGGVILLSAALKKIMSRPRPELWQRIVTETGPSFPSVHATASMALALVVVALLWRTKWRVYSIIGAVLYVPAIGLSRLYLGVHYPSDIMGGWLLSIGWVSLVALGCILFARSRAKKSQEV